MTIPESANPPHRERVLITVKTYPLPSTSAGRELVCTAGVRQDGSFIRLYPIDYRYRPYSQWFSKYQWVELDVRRKKGDYRPETFEPVKGSVIRPIGKPIPTTDNWAERRRYVLAAGVQTMCSLASLDDTQKSLGIIRPRTVSDLIVTPDDRQWKPRWDAVFLQRDLFESEQKPLEKIPYKFTYSFTCEQDECKGHRMMTADWEVGQLYRKMRDKHGSEEVAAAKVKETFFNTICAPKRDTHFFVGTVMGHGTWIVLGTFWPERLP